MTTDLFVNADAGVLDAEPALGARPSEFHRLLPGYEPTPLLECPSLASALGVARVLVKDESSRAGLPSFKILGASWATVSAIAREWLGTPEWTGTIDELSARIPQRERRRLVAATDGNHGRGIARMARLLRLACTIYVPRGTASARIDDIRGEGAETIVIDGTYDDAIARSARDAGPDTLVVSDTSWEGYTETPASVIRGYSTMFEEIDERLVAAASAAPDVVAFQAGVGAFAAAGLRHYRSAEGGPRTIIVEPDSANCLLTSAREGGIVEVPGPHPSTMAGLNCGLPSLLAWPVVAATADVFIAIPDEATYEAMRALARTGLIAGESGAAGLGGLLSAADDDDTRRAVGLAPDATVLVIVTEGATDPLNFERVVGESPEHVAAESSARRRTNNVRRL